MPSVRFNREDFQGKTPMKPGWYKLSVGEFVEKQSKDGDSTNFWGEFTVTDDGEHSGTKLRHCFNEKALGYAGGAVDFMACFTNEPEKLMDMEVIDALKQTTDHTVQGYVEWDPEFRRNQIKDWRASK